MSGVIHVYNIITSKTSLLQQLCYKHFFVIFTFVKSNTVLFVKASNVKILKLSDHFSENWNIDLLRYFSCSSLHNGRPMNCNQICIEHRVQASVDAQQILP